MCISALFRQQICWMVCLPTRFHTGQHSRFVVVFFCSGPCCLVASCHSLIVLPLFSKPRWCWHSMTQMCLCDMFRLRHAISAVASKLPERSAFFSTEFEPEKLSSHTYSLPSCQYCKYQGFTGRWVRKGAQRDWKTSHTRLCSPLTDFTRTE